LATEYKDTLKKHTGLETKGFLPGMDQKYRNK